MITLMQVIQELRPGAQCRISGDTYNDIIWDDKNQTIPTEDEVTVKIAELQTAEPMRLLRQKRNELIAETDWTQLPDALINAATDYIPLDYRNKISSHHL